MRAAHRAVLVAAAVGAELRNHAAVGAELRNHGCPNLRFLNHTGLNVTCVRLARPHRAKRCLLDGVAALARSRRSSSMLQVGAHLAFGNANDPFKRLALDVINHTVLVEPQPGVYRDLAALVAAHADPAHRIAVVNRAVSDRDGVVTFHTINDTLIDPATGCYRRGFGPPPGGKTCPASFTSQIASLSLKNILKHKHWIPNLEALVVDVEVRASTVRTLLDEHDLRDDLVVLSVDAEGHDQIIVRSVDLSKITPYFIVFEHMHIMHSASGALRHVMESGYDCLMETENYFCVRDRALFAACRSA